MATPIKNNLPPASQQWVRDMEKRLVDLERQNQLLQIMANKNATQLASMQEGVRSARSGIQSVSIRRDVAAGTATGSDLVSTDIPVPAWARSVTVILTGFIDMRALQAFAGLAVRSVVLSGGPDRVIAQTPGISAQTANSFPTPDSTNNVVVTASTPINAGDNYLSLEGGYNWQFDPPPGGSGINYYWGLTAIWSANPYNEEF